MRRRGWRSSPRWFVRRVFNAVYEDNVPFLASALTFDALLWFVPFVLLVLAGAGYLLGDAADLGLTVTKLFARFLPPHDEADPFTAVEKALSDVVASRTQLSLTGIPLFIWFSMRLFGSIRAALNDVFDVDERRPFVQGKLMDLLLGLVTALFVTINMAISTFVLVPDLWIARFFATLFAYCSTVALFFVVYRAAPSRPLRWDTALVAAIVASLAFEVVKRFYAIYLTQFATADRIFSNANAIALVLFVLWVYYTAWIFLAGGEVADTYDLARRQRQQREALG